MRRLALLLALVAVAACDTMPGDPPVFTGTAADLAAPEGRLTFYAFVADRDGTGDEALPTATGRVVPVDSATSLGWDFALRGTEIFLNGGTSGPGAGVGVVVDVPFERVTDALVAGDFYRRDGESPCPTGPARAVCPAPGDGWFETAPLPGGGTAVVPRPGRTLLLRRGDGQGYAKVAVESYYRGAPDPVTAGSEPGFYTLRFAVDPDGASFVDDEPDP